MKTYTLLINMAVLTAFLQGCTPGTGADAALLNQTRGHKNAQISKAQARQYARQQRLAADEVRLQNMKRRQTTDAIHESSDAVHDTTSVVRDVKNLLRGW